jgi:UDP-N-acetylmuramoyl-tripeptide--D-alanyl-D-alanine ligase
MGDGVSVLAKEVVEATGGTLLSGDPALRLARLHTDSREVTPGGLFVALKGEQQDGHTYIADALARGAAGILVEQRPESVNGALVIQVADTRRALIELTRQRLAAHKIPVVGVTGSAGKTTTKDLIAHVLGRRLRVRKSEGNLNTYTGIPMTVFELEPADRVLVMEYAMSRMGEIKELTSMAPPNIAIVLNVGLAHVGYLGSIDAVAKAKRELVEGMVPDGLAVLNVDDQRVKAMAPAARRVTLYGFAREASVRADRVKLHGLEGSAFTLKTPKGESQVFLRLPGRHSISNALAAAAVALEFGFDAAAIASALHGFTPPSRRMNIVAGLNGSTIIDDCYNASPGSMEAALEVVRLAPKGALRIAVLGDMLELGQHAGKAHFEVGQLAGRSVDRLVVLGEFARDVVNGAIKGGLSPAQASIAADVEEAIARVRPWLTAGTRVLVKGSRGMRMERVVEALRKEDA